MTSVVECQSIEEFDTSTPVGDTASDVVSDRGLTGLVVANGGAADPCWSESACTNDLSPGSWEVELEAWEGLFLAVEASSSDLKS